MTDLTGKWKCRKNKSAISKQHKNLAKLRMIHFRSRRKSFVPEHSFLKCIHSLFGRMHVQYIWKHTFFSPQLIVALTL